MTNNILSQDNALKTDLYELTMAAGYFENNVKTTATFELFCHTMPEKRSYIIACGLKQILEYIQNLRFTKEDIRFLKKIPALKGINKKFFEYLKKFRFSGDLYSVEEGEIVFAQEPILQVVAPIIEAQILETYLLSIINIESLVATKASRVVLSAEHDGIQRGVIDFGSRRAHGPQAAVLAARAAYLGGCIGTSNVYAGRSFGIPTFGTVAHSWIESFDSEDEAFIKYHNVFPKNTILLIDTYDTIKAAKKLKSLKDHLDIKGVRIDSGNLEQLSKKVRLILNNSGLEKTKIVASGNLNEYKIWDLVRSKAPIDIFGVGTDMVVSRDVPALDLTYKLVQTSSGAKDTKLKFKTSKGKETMPGRKQIFRHFNTDGTIKKDTIGLFHEKKPAHAKKLLKPVIRKGKRVQKILSENKIRENIRKKLAQLPSEFLKVQSKKSFKPTYSKKIINSKNLLKTKL